MKNYTVNENPSYMGYGQAFAKIEGEIVIQLTYFNSLVSSEDWDWAPDDDPAIYRLNATGDAKIKLFAKAHPELIEGMCNGGEFSTYQVAFYIKGDIAI